MTDPIIIDEPAAATVRPRRGGRLLLSVAGLLIIIGGVLYLLAPSPHPRMTMDQVRQQAAATPDAEPAAPVPFDAGRVVALETEIDQLRQRVAALEQRAPIQAPAPAPAAPAIATGGAAPPSDAAMVALGARLDALAGRQDRADAQAISTADQLRTDEAKLEAAGNQATAVAAVTDRAAKLARVQAAEAALGAGLPLGTLPEAPPTLDRYRTEPPPTEAALRIAFPAVAGAARGAARADTKHLGFWAAMRARAEALITIRRGDRVLVGNDQIGIVDQARAALDAGDLAGAVAMLGRLDGPAAAAVAQWRGQAQGLLDARAALARLAGQS